MCLCDNILIYDLTPLPPKKKIGNMQMHLNIDFDTFMTLNGTHRGDERVYFHEL